MPLYTFDAENVPERTTSTEIVLQIIIFRDGERAATIYQRVPAGASNQAIRQAVQNRLLNFIRVDADRIALEDVTARAEAISDVIDGWEIDSESL